MRLELGKPIPCADGALRQLADVVVDSATIRVTHLVVHPDKQPEDATTVQELIELYQSQGKK